jgi:multidrug efflux pump
MLARFFIDRPIFAWVLSLVIILIGVVAIPFLPVDLYPPITPPTVQVSASYPGANAQVVANTIAAPIEEQVNGVENMLYMSSQSNNDGSYTLTVTFQIGTDVNLAQVLVENRVALALPQLPAQVQLQGVTTKKTSPNILFGINLLSPDGRYDPLFLSNFATIQLQDEILRINGVGDVHVLGAGNSGLSTGGYSMRIWLKPNELATRNLTAVDVVSAIQSQNVQVAAGQIGQEPIPPGQRLQLPMSALGRLETAKQFGDIILKAPPQHQGIGVTANPVVRIRDVATVELGGQSYDLSCHLDGRPSAIMAVFQLPGSNALDVAHAVKKRMTELKTRFPPGLEYRIVYDTTPFIEESINDVYRTLVLAVLLVALVVLLFLQDWRAMILPMIDVPVSLFGAVAVMAVLGFSLNNLTLFGLVLAIGIVVDDAIVVLENIERLMATGLDARSATQQAMRELTGPILAITLVLSSVFLPSLLVPGLTGQFYRQFAVTIAAAMIISALNAMTLTPSRAVSIFRTEEAGATHELRREALPWWIFGIGGGLLTWWLGETYLPGLVARAEASSTWMLWLVRAACFLPGLLLGGLIGWFIIRPVNAVLGWLFRQFNRLFDRITEVYGRAIGKLLRISAIVMLLYGGLLALTYWRVASAPTGFIPEQDQGYLLLNVQLPDAASAERTRAVMAQVDQIARATPGVAHTVGIAGTSFLLTTNASNLGSMFVVLEPFDQRRTADKYDTAIAQRLRERCAREVEGAVIGVFRSPPIRGLGNAGGFQLQTEQHGYVDHSELQASTDELVRRVNADPHFAGVFTLFRAHTPQLFIDIDRTKVEALQVPIQDVFTTLQVYMGGLYVNQFNRFGRTWQVQVQAAAPFRTAPSQVQELMVRNSQGQMVPLGTVARIDNITGPLFVMRYNMYASAAVNGTAAPGVSSGDMIGDITRLARELDVPFEWTQLTYLQVQAGNIALLIFALGTVLVYLVLAAQYESWRLPLAVILVVPLCMLAAVTGMTIAHLPVDIFVQIGMLVLVGLASKNAILIVEYARERRQAGQDTATAAHEASHIRLRPIIMTSVAFTFGVLPLLLATGAGAEMRRALGTAVFAGMIGVTLFGIFLTPVFFYVLMRFGGDRVTGPPAVAEQTPTGVCQARSPEARSASQDRQSPAQEHEAQRPYDSGR